MQPPSSHRRREGAGNQVVLYVLAGVGGLAVLGCLACGAAGYFGWHAAVEAIGSQVQQQYGNDPVLQEHIGEIQSFQWNFTDSQAVREEMGSKDYLSFDVEGTQGTGQLIIHNAPGSGKRGFDAAILRTSEGEFELD